MQRYQDINAETIDRWVNEGWEWGRPIDHATYEAAERGEWEVRLTPTKAVPREWVGDISGHDLLGLCSGGGQQGPIFSAAGARVTIIDYSAAQIASERAVAAREGYDIACVQADVTLGLPFADESFDIVFNPVSICYIREVEALIEEVFRVLRPGGVFLCGFDTIVNYLVDADEERIVWSMPFDPTVQEEPRRFLQEDDAGMQFSHDLTETLGTMLKCGFMFSDLYEDTNGEGRLHEMNIPTYVAVRALKPTSSR